MGTDLNPVPPAQIGTMRPLPLTKKQQYAARLVAEGELSQVKICERVGIGRRTLNHWLQDPEYGAFQKRLAEYRQRYAALVMNTGLARKERRVKHLTDLYGRLHTVIRERAKDPAMEKVPGGKTGVVTRTVKALEVTESVPEVTLNAKGKLIRTMVQRTVKKLIPEYKTDVATVAELRAIQEQIAVEVGDREPEQPGQEVALTAIAITVKYEKPHLTEAAPQAFIEAPRIQIKRQPPEPENGDLA
jgi:DNA-binding CsgD family transcriptional regulator